MQSVIETGPDHPPFFVYLGPHAPHKPSTPAPWYADHPVGDTPIDKGPYYNYLATGKHAFLPHEAPISSVDEAAIQYEYSMRLRTLLSVDDLVRGVREYVNPSRVRAEGLFNPLALLVRGSDSNPLPPSHQGT